MYEILWRHFSIWGVIEDVNLVLGQGKAFIKYQHRCMAEFAKEAMTRQSLDLNEILTIKWAVETKTTKEDQQKDEETYANVKQEIYEKDKRKQNKIIQSNEHKLAQEDSINQ